MGQCMIKEVHLNEPIHSLDSTTGKSKESNNKNGTSKSN